MMSSAMPSAKNSWSGPGDIFQVLFAAIGERGVQAVADIVMHPGRNSHAARRRNLLQPGGDVDAVAQDVVAINDDVTQVNTDAEDYAPVLINAGVAFRHALLNFDHALGRIHHGGELQQQAIAHGLDDAAAMFGNLAVDHFRPVGPQTGQGPSLVHAHELGIADYVGGYDGRQPALCSLRHHSHQTMPIPVRQ